MNEKEIILGIKNNKTECLEQLIELYSGYVVHIVSAILTPCASREDIKEVTSDVFYAIWRVRAGLQETVTLKPYIAIIARNTALKKLKGVKNNISLSDGEGIILKSDDDLEQTFEQNERFFAVREALNALKDEDKEIFLRYYYLCQTVSEISKSTGLGNSAVKSRLMRGRAKLKEILNERGFEYE